ncbi:MULTISPECIES: 2-oxo-4-hydroxy-4-carboxy-5-ureidoimidazoline decarboxylase [Halomonadaceae]|uniref:2-oxo-4-hydroxy-4-carboxy-5-ureidoimidazoline decarboxylase n=1 Tax=Vreelandella halophila TaxID=86177 RepID=A0A9X5B5T2_9GAMM|nr:MULTISPECIES: 2-oxo-4-hydroxy-4-carboxy-5-ureidoimidazoline decarboxylase [Halomonas]MYL27911.1 2-oxo-4-hydroxy-4-carboxy-5-ureidoimidazoline decarboxylase [Halomonas utahensis]MYL75037.1 2-oxo-4-hydroxy-4-carboxy-5-ureidoimidazoline decarboxylase [Halomonas sp. 22501_18_FS]
MTLDELNVLTQRAAFDMFHECCHCERWATRMVLARPFASIASLLDKADEFWSQSSRAEILEAFSGHARIGDMEALREKFSGATGHEQGQVLETSEATLEQLYELNLLYEQRHGFIFIICATGKSADEMLAALKARIDNPTGTEIINGAREQGAINQLRLQRALSDTGEGHDE